MPLHKLFDKKTLTLVFSGVFLCCYTAVAQAPVQIHLFWKNKTFTFPGTIDTSTKVQIIIHQLGSSSDAIEFLKKTKIKIINGTDTNVNRSLYDQINAEASDNPDNLIKLGTGIPTPVINLTKYIKLSQGDQLTFTPFLGTINGKPVVDPQKTPTIQVKKGGDAQPQAADQRIKQQVDDIQATVDQHQKIIENHNDRINLLDESLQNSVNNLNNQVTAQQQTINVLSTRRHKKDKSIPKNEVLRQPYFTSDCNGCIDEEGDLVYDFKCKRLLRVHYLDSVSEPNHYRVAHYYLVRDLTDLPIRAQELIRLKVVGVNRYLYNVNAEVEDSIFNNEAPPIFGQFFSGTGDFVNGLITGVQKAQTDANTLSKGTLSEDQKRNSQQQFADLKKMIREFQRKYNKLREQRVNAYILCADANCCNFPPKVSFSEYADLLSDIRFQISEIEAAYLATIPSGDEINKRIASFQKTLDDCAKKPATTNNTSNTDSAKTKTTKKTDSTKGKNTKKTDNAKAGNTPSAGKDTTTKNNPDSVKQGQSTAQADKPDPCATDNVKKLTDSIATMKELLPLRTTIDNLKASLPSIEDLEKIYLFDMNVVKEQFYYRLPPIYPQGDKLHISLKINSRDSVIAAEMKYMPPTHDELSLDFSVQNKFLFSFSSGPFTAFGNDMDRASYGWQRVPASGSVIGPDASYRLVQTSNAPLPVGIGGYANLGKKISRTFGLAFTCGGGITFNQDILPAFMGGITGSFGDKQRVNLTIGAGGVQVKELKSALYLGTLYQTQPTLDYDRPMKFAFFATLSYSILTSTSRLNIFSSSNKHKH